MKIQPGSTSRSVPINIQDSSSTTGALLASLVYNSSGLVFKWRREFDSAFTTGSLVTATAGTWTSSGFIEVFSGRYELGLTNAMIAGGLPRWCDVELYGATNMVPLSLRLDLDWGLPVLYQSTLQSATSTTAVLDATTPAGTVRNGYSILITSGTGSGQRRAVISFSSVTALIYPQWTTTPDNTSTYQVIVDEVSLANVAFTNGNPAVTSGGNFSVNLVTLLGTTVSTPATAGIMDVNLKNIANAAVSTSAAQLGVNVVNYAGGAVPAPNVTGVPLVDVKYVLGTISPAAAGSVAIDWAQVGNQSSTVNLSNTTIKGVTLATANVTQWNGTNVAVPNVAGVPITDTAYIKGTTIPTAGYMPLDWGHITAPATTVNLSGTTIGTITAYTGNTPQTGDSYAIVNNASYGNAHLVRSTTPANTLTVNADGSVNANLMTWLGSTPNTLKFGIVDAGSIVWSGTATDGGSNYIVLDAGANTSTGFFAGDVIRLVGGTGSGQSKVIASYQFNLSAVKAFILGSWTTNPDATTQFIIESGGVYNVNPNYWAYGQLGGSILAAGTSPIHSSTSTNTIVVNSDQSINVGGYSSGFSPAQQVLINPTEPIKTDSSGNVFIASGSITTHAATLRIQDQGQPVQAAQVWISTDSAGLNVIAGTLTTDSNGDVTFMLYANTTYFYWVQKNGINSALGVQFTTGS